MAELQPLPRTGPLRSLTRGRFASAVLDGIELGSTEALVDEASRHFKRAVAGPVEGLLPTAPVSAR